MSAADIKEVIVLGASGGFGTLFSQVLAKSGVTVRGISRKGTPKPEATFSDYLSADPCNPNEEVISRVRSASVIVSCVPPGPCVRALEALAPYMSEGCLFLDVLSVKTEICNSYNQLKDKYPHVELLSCHPMFAPAAGWDGQNTVMIEITGGSKSKAFTALVETWGSTCVAMATGEQHDRVTAAVQNATHSALIAFGLSLKKIGYDAEMAAKISTPPHRAMISVIQRMASINEPDTYWDIQTENPHAGECWTAMEEAVKELKTAVETRDRDGFCKVIADFKETLGSGSGGACKSPY